MIRSLLLYPAELIALFAFVLLMVRVRLGPPLLRIVVSYCIIIYIILFFVEYPEADQLPGADLFVYWRAGGAWLRGESPYRIKGIVYPPTAAPIIALYGLMSLRIAGAVWITFNAVASLALVPLTYLTLKSFKDSTDFRLPPEIVGLLTVLVSFSFAARAAVVTGQWAFLALLAVIGALRAQAGGRPIWAGVCLALGTIKAGVMLPFLLLFHRRRDFLTWVSLGTTALVLCLAMPPVSELPERCRECLDNIAAFAGPGGENDYSYENKNKSYADMIGFDHLLYRIGLRDRSLVRIGQLVGLLLVGAWVAGQVIRRPELPWVVKCSYVAFYSPVFLYHRCHDALILSIPLLYSTSRMRDGQGLVRALHALCALLILAVLYVRIKLLQQLTLQFGYADDFRGRLIEAVILPYCTWFVLIGLACFALAESRRARTVFEAR